MRSVSENVLLVRCLQSGMSGMPWMAGRRWGSASGSLSRSLLCCIFWTDGSNLAGLGAGCAVEVGRLCKTGVAAAAEALGDSGRAAVFLCRFLALGERINLALPMGPDPLLCTKMPKLWWGAVATALFLLLPAVLWILRDVSQDQEVGEDGVFS